MKGDRLLTALEIDWFLAKLRVVLLLVVALGSVVKMIVGRTAMML